MVLPAIPGGLPTYFPASFGDFGFGVGLRVRDDSCLAGCLSLKLEAVPQI